jgi:hypothetical protein
MNTHRHNDQGWGGDQRHEAAARAPLAAHPLFPGIVALWLAALLAIGALMVPAALLERAAAALRLDLVVPAARPPLGFTARLLVAFALALVGALAGYLAARWLARRARPSRRARRAAPKAAVAEPAESVPSAAMADDDDEAEDFARLAAARPAPQRRRALISESDEAARAILEISAIPALEPLAPVAAGIPPESAPAPAPAPASAAPTGPRFRSAAELGGEAAMRLCAAPLESLGVVQLVERFALAVAARRLRDAARSTGEALLARPAFPPAPPFAEPGEPRPAPSGRPFDMPGDPAGGPVPDPAAELARWSLPEPESDPADDDRLPASPGDSSYSSLLDMRPATRAPAPLAEFVRVEDQGEGGYGEAGPQPVVVFPGQAVPAPPIVTHLPGIEGPASPVQTEQALREALAALQRMSGAA